MVQTTCYLIGRISASVCDLIYMSTLDNPNRTGYMITQTELEYDCWNHLISLNSDIVTSYTGIHRSNLMYHDITPEAHRAATRRLAFYKSNPNTYYDF